MKNNIQIIEINQKKIVEKKFPCNEKNDLDNFNYYQKKNEDKINERKRRRMQRKKRIRKRIIFIFKTYNLFIFNLVCFIIIFISGFIVHYDIIQNVTASSILWTFSSIICIFAILYSYCYYKCLHAKSDKEIQKYLKYIPC